MSQFDSLKATCYLRVARGPRRFLFNATTRPSAAPLTSGPYGDPLPTRQFKLVLDLPAALFAAIDGTVKVEVPASALAEVIQADAEVPE